MRTRLKHWRPRRLTAGPVVGAAAGRARRVRRLLVPAARRGTLRGQRPRPQEGRSQVRNSQGGGGGALPGRRCQAPAALLHFVTPLRVTAPSRQGFWLPWTSTPRSGPKGRSAPSKSMVSPRPDPSAAVKAREAPGEAGLALMASTGQAHAASEIDRSAPPPWELLKYVTPKEGESVWPQV